MSEYDSFITLLSSLKSEDNKVRQESEQYYEAIPAQQRLIFLIQAITDNTRDNAFKIFSSVLCRRLIVDDYKNAFLSHSKDYKQQIQSQILLSITSEQDKNVRFKIADVAAALANVIFEGDDDEQNTVPAGTWPALAQLINECNASEDVNLRLIGCHLFTALPNIYGDGTAANLPVIGQMLASGLSDQTNREMRDEALKALTAFLEVNGSMNSVMALLRDLIPMVINAIMLGLKDEDDNETGLKCLCEMIDNSPKFLRPSLTEVLSMCFEILCNKELPDSPRQLALTCIVLLAEKLPAAVRKSGQFVEQLVYTLLGMMTEVEEVDKWESADVLDQEDEEENACVACRSLDSIAIAIGGQHVVTEIVRTVPVMLKNEDWKHRHAGLMAISYCGEGCRKQMDDMLESILGAIMPLLDDPHPRVRYAAGYALAQMSSDFSPKMQRLHHAMVLPPLMTKLDDPCPRVQANAATALINFIETLPKPILTTYLEALISKLEHGMQAQFQRMTATGAKMVLIQIVDTVSIVAETAEDKFIPYYSRFMPGLKVIIESCASHKELRELRGIVVQCISIIGLAVGQDVFRQDMEPILKLLLKTQASTTKEAGGDASAEDEEEPDNDDPQLTYMIRAWARICKLLGPDFEPYLPMVMPQLMATAQIKPEICLVDNDDADEVRGEDEWEVVKFSNDEHLAVRTSGLDDKATACEMLVCYARELKDKFAAYADEVLDIMLPLLNFYLNDEVRLSAAEILPYLLVCLSQNPEAVQAAWIRISEALFNAIPAETDVDAEAELLGSLSGCIERLGNGCLTDEQLNKIHVQMDRLFEKHFAKDEERNERRQDEDHDKENEEAILAEKDEDEKVLVHLNELMHTLMITHRDQAVAIFNALVPYIEKLMQPDRPYADLQWAICFWDDLIEFGGETAWTYSERYLPTLVSCMSHAEPTVRQAAVYAVSVMAQYACPQFHPLLKQFVPTLLALIEAPDSRSTDNVECTENAISAITKIMKYHPEVMAEFGSFDELIAKWFTWLPIWEDESETDAVYSYLCELTEQNHPGLLGTTIESQKVNLTRVIAVIAECFVNKGLNKEGPVDSHTGRPINFRGSAMANQGKGDGKTHAYYRCISLLKFLQRIGASLFNECFEKLTEDQQSAIQKLLTVA